MAELNIKYANNGEVHLEMKGRDADIAKLICFSMINHIEFASIVLSAIPSFLDTKNLDRKGFCEMIMQSKGNK